MSASTATGPLARHLSQLFTCVGLSAARLASPPSHSRRAQAARHWARRSLALAAVSAMAIVALMYVLDAAEIGWMPARGTAGLWPVRIMTDFGKSSYVLWTLAAILALLAVISPRLRGRARGALIALSTRVAFVFFAVLVSVLAAELLKGTVGRARPFVGGEANAFNYSHFAWSEGYASFPSSHAVTAFALAFAVAALWPRLRGVMIVYALVIAASRLVLLAHHPSDVVAGAILGVLGAMLVRYWFAARRLAFIIRRDGAIDPRAGPSAGHLKGIVRGAFAP